MDNQDLDDRTLASGQGIGGNARNGLSEPDAQRLPGTLLVFKRPGPTDEHAILQLNRLGPPPCAVARRKVPQLISKHAPRNWRPRVGTRVAGLSEGRIIQGVVLGVKAKPWQAATFCRHNFYGCWLLLDSGKKIVANELRPILEVRTGS